MADKSIPPLKNVGPPYLPILKMSYIHHAVEIEMERLTDRVGGLIVDKVDRGDD